jgi:hypothetical protein
MVISLRPNLCEKIRISGLYLKKLISYLDMIIRKSHFHLIKFNLHMQILGVMALKYAIKYSIFKYCQKTNFPPVIQVCRQYLNY